MTKLKEFEVTYRAEIKCVALVLAKNEKEARQKFDMGDVEDDEQIDCYNIDDVCVNKIE